MPNYIIANGEALYTPGPIGEIEYAVGTGQGAPFKNLALIGDWPFLPAAKPFAFGSKVSALRVDPDNQELKRCTTVAYDAHNDPRIRGGPSGIVLVNVRPTTAAYLNLLDADDEPAVLLTTKLYGKKGNQAKALVEIDGSGRYNLTLSLGGVVEPFGPIAPLNLFSLRYVGSDFATVYAGKDPRGLVASGSNNLVLPQATINVVSTGEFAIDGEVRIKTDRGWEVITYTGKTDTTLTGCTGGLGTLATNQPVRSVLESEFYVMASGTELTGTQAYDVMWNGKVQVSTAQTAAASETYTVTITGLDMEGEAQTAVLQWLTGTTGLRTTIVDFSRITQIVFAQAGGTPTTPTFIVTGDILRDTQEDVATPARLAQILDDESGDFTVASVDDMASSLGLGAMDPTPKTNITSAAHIFVSVKQAIATALGASSIVTAEALAGAGAPVAMDSTKFAGGSRAATISSDDWTAAFASAERIPLAIVWPNTDVDAIHKLGRAHCRTMAGGGRNPRNMWVGAAPNETLDQLDARTKGLNTRHLSLVAQEIKRTDGDGSKAWLAPKYLALECAAMQAGTREAVTFKIPNADEYRQHSSWDPHNDQSRLAQSMVTTISDLVNGQSAVVTRVVRALTTIRSTNDPAQTDVKPNESLNEFLNFAYGELVERIGDPTTAPIEIIRTEWKKIGERADGRPGGLAIIERATTEKFTADRVANVTILGGPVKPAYSQDFFLLKVSVDPETNTAGFTLQLAE